MEPLFFDKTLLSGEINIQKLLLCVKVNPKAGDARNPNGLAQAQRRKDFLVFCDRKPGNKVLTA